MQRKRSLSGGSAELRKNSFGLKTGSCKSAWPHSTSVYTSSFFRLFFVVAFFNKYKTDGKIWDWDKIVVIKGWLLDRVGH